MVHTTQLSILSGRNDIVNQFFQTWSSIYSMGFLWKVFSLFKRALKEDKKGGGPAFVVGAIHMVHQGYT